jgi:predicted secreted protein
VIEIVDGDLRVRSIAQAMARARTLAAEIAADASVGNVNAFLAERRREAASEP